MKPDYRNEKSFRIPEFGEIRLLITNRNALELVLTLMPISSGTDKIEFLLVIDENGRYRFFDRSNTSIIEEPFDGCGLA